MDFWNQRYQTDEFVFGIKPNDWIHHCESVLPRNSHILSLGEGEGRNAVYLAEQDHRVLGVDGSEVGLRKAKDLAFSKGVTIETKVSFLEDYEPGEALFDVVISVFCHLPKQEREILHQRCFDALKPNGLLILEAYHPDQLQYKTGGPPELDRLVSLKQLELEFGVDRGQMIWIEAEETVRDMSEGHAHQGRSAVVHVLGRKVKD